MSDRESALAQIRELAAANNLSFEDIRSTLEEDPESALANGDRGGVLAKVMGYIGGIFLFAGVATFIGINWDSFPSLARVLVTLGHGISVFIAAVVVERDGRWPLMAAPAYLTAEVLQPTGMLVAFDEFGSGGDWRIAVAITSFAIMVQALAAVRIAGSGVLVFAAVFFGVSLAVTLFDMASIDETLYTLVAGLSMMLVALGIDAARYRWNVSAWASVGSVFFFVALFDLVKDEPFEILFAVMTGFGVYVSVQTRARAILVTSVLSFLLYISYFTAEHFSDSLGWPLVLMLIGVAFVAVGYGALRFNRQYFQA